MFTAEKVRLNIRKMKPGTVFLVSDLPTYNEQKIATVKAVNYYYLSTIQKEKYGSVSKIADGMYYKEENGVLGKLPPTYDSVLHALTYSKNKKVGFVSGHQLFNQKGLSTQVPAITTVVTSKKSPAKINFAGIKIEIIKKTEAIKEKDIKRYEFEYILNNLSRVQSTEFEKISESLSDYIELVSHDRRQFKKLFNHLQYKKTKALLGALIEDYQEIYNKNDDSILNEIKKDLSSRSKYRLGNVSSYINHKKEWNIEF